MQLYPAIDMKNGRCVRLRQGKFKNITVYSEHPDITHLQAHKTARNSECGLLLEKKKKQTNYQKKHNRASSIKIYPAH